MNQQDGLLLAEQQWLKGKTDWWPDTLEINEASSQITRAGCPSSRLPATAQGRIERLNRKEKRYVTHIAPGVHAYKIGFVDEYRMDFDTAWEDTEKELVKH